MSEIQKFDAEQAMKSVKEKIKDTFVSLIPDEQWNEMVKKEVDKYFESKVETYNTQKWSSSFSYDVHSVLSQEVKDRVKDYLLNNFKTVWEANGKPKCDAKMEEFIVQNSGKILADMIGSTIQMALSNAGYRIS